MQTDRTIRRLPLAAATLVLTAWSALALTGCRSDEQNRPLQFNPASTAGHRISH